MAKTTKNKEKINDALSEINSIKSDLLDVYKKLNELGANKKAEKLFNLIGKIEGFQCSARES